MQCYHLCVLAIVLCNSHIIYMLLCHTYYELGAYDPMHVHAPPAPHSESLVLQRPENISDSS